MNYLCPYRHRCGCMVALAVKEFPNRFELHHSGNHDRHSHRASTGILSVKQRNAVISSVKAAPMAASGTVQSNLKNFSPGKRVPHDAKSTSALGRLVKTTRRKLLGESIPPGITIDGSEGPMIKLAESISLKALILKHNDPSDPFHLDEHTTVCLGFQFKNNVRYMCLSTPHLLNNLARAANCGWQNFLHMDGGYNWCGKDFGLVAYGMNSMGSHYNPVSISIVNNESKASLTTSWRHTASGVYNLYQQVKLCSDETCGFCTQLSEQIQLPHGKLWRDMLASPSGRAHYYHIDKPGSDHTKSWYAVAKSEWGPDIPVQQCANHAGRTFPIFLNNFFNCFNKFLRIFRNAL